MKIVLMGIAFILAPAFGMALAKLIIDPLWSNQKVSLEGLITFFIYGLVAGVILFILRLIVRGGSLN
ncbi:hypothetical protein [Alkalihalobacillus sp. R86527]|uniref:hypothetical protein n=1 Tax=Alkalihalobacillus sp. R86527 TaxID=3093863 RepID=UPI00366DF60C